MRYYPVLLNLNEKPVIVLGGGPVAERKVLPLLACGARVTVISPSLTKKLSYLAQAGAIRYRKKRWGPADVRGAFMILATTNDPKGNADAARRIDSELHLINVADDPSLCNFIMPSVITRGNLIIAVSTSGKSPALARRIRQELEKSFGTAYGQFVRLLGDIRDQVRKQVPSIRRQRNIMNRLAASDVLSLLRAGHQAQASRRIRRIVGLKELELRF